jgi:long-subunit acyl-CoA synthetase (AMP-forming)
MSRSDVKEVGEMLDDSEAALIVVGEATLEDATKRAKKELKKEIRADAREMERAVDEA